MTGGCLICRQRRQLSELTAVTRRRRPWIGYYVCRPDVARVGDNCFRRATGPYDSERIDPGDRCSAPWTQPLAQEEPR